MSGWVLSNDELDMCRMQCGMSDVWLWEMFKLPRRQIPAQRQVPVTLPVTLLCLQRKMPAMLTFMQNLPKQLFNLYNVLPWV